MHLIANLITLFGLVASLGGIWFMINGHREAIINALLGTRFDSELRLIQTDHAHIRAVVSYRLSSCQSASHVRPVLLAA